MENKIEGLRPDTKWLKAEGTEHTPYLVVYNNRYVRQWGHPVSSLEDQGSLPVIHRLNKAGYLVLIECMPDGSGPVMLESGVDVVLDKSGIDPFPLWEKRPSTKAPGPEDVPDLELDSTFLNQAIRQAMKTAYFFPYNFDADNPRMPGIWATMLDVNGYRLSLAYIKGYWRMKDWAAAASAIDYANKK